MAVSSFFSQSLYCEGEKMADENYILDSLMKVEEHRRQIEERRKKV